MAAVSLLDAAGGGGGQVERCAVARAHGTLIGLHARRFALVTKTLYYSVSEVGGFMIVFFAVFYGFSAAFMIAFGKQVRGASLAECRGVPPCAHAHACLGSTATPTGGNWAQVLEYRNLRTSAYSLLRSLLGDFNLGQLVGAQYLLGIVMFSMFVAVAILVVLNVLMCVPSQRCLARNSP